VLKRKSLGRETKSLWVQSFRRIMDMILNWGSKDPESRGGGDGSQFSARPQHKNRRSEHGIVITYRDCSDHLWIAISL
jgi:hypothetical protein